MSAILDISTLLILGWIIFYTCRKGFVRVALGLVSFILALIIAAAFAPMLQNALYTGMIGPSLTRTVEERVSSISTSDEPDFEHLINDERAPVEFMDFIKGFGSSAENVAELLEKARDAGVDNVNRFVAENIVEPVGKQAAYFLSFLIIFIAVKIVLKLIGILLTKILEALPFFRTLNKAAGLVLGVALAFVYVSLFAFLVPIILPYISALSSGASPETIIGETLLFGFFYDFNLLTLLFGGSHA